MTAMPVDGATDATNETADGDTNYVWFDDAFRVTQYVYGVPMSVTIVAGNLLLLSVLARDAALRKIITNVLNLAVCDLIAGVTLGVNIATRHLHARWRTNIPLLCLLWSSFEVGYINRRLHLFVRIQLSDENLPARAADH